MIAPLILISGPSGSGKTTLARMLLSHYKDLHFVATYTTRAPRPGEVNGRDYFFVTKEIFIQLDNAHAFLETNNYAGTWYATPRSALHKLRNNIACLVVPDVNGGIAIAQQVSNIIPFWIDII